MEKLLFKVKDRFYINDLGLILTPGIGDMVYEIKTGNKVKLIRPDKSELDSKIIGISTAGGFNILLDKRLKKDDVPIETEVWLVD